MLLCVLEIDRITIDGIQQIVEDKTNMLCYQHHVFFLQQMRVIENERQAIMVGAETTTDDVRQVRREQEFLLQL